jgi:hypothetical protein
MEFPGGLCDRIDTARPRQQLHSPERRSPLHLETRPDRDVHSESTSAKTSLLINFIADMQIIGLY